MQDVQHMSELKREMVPCMRQNITLSLDQTRLLNNHRLKPVGLSYGLKVRIRVD